MTSVDETRETPQRQTAEFGRLRIDFDERVLRPRAWTAAPVRVGGGAAARRAARTGARAVRRGRAHRPAGDRGSAAPPGERRPEPGGRRLHPAQRGGRRPRRRTWTCARARWSACSGRTSGSSWSSRTRRGCAARRSAATPRTRCWPSTAATTAWTWRGCASPSPPGTWSRAARPSCSSGRVGQVEALRADLARKGQWVVEEVRSFERGSLVRLVRGPAQPAPD